MLVARGMCNKHYKRLKKHGSVVLDKEPSFFDEGGYKVCPSCGENKHQSEYFKVKGGSKSHCKECFRAEVTDYRQRNKDKVKKWGAAYAKRHPDKMCEKVKRRNHMKRAAGEFPKEFKLMPHCWVCLSTENLTVDHIIPITRGGTNEIDNLTTLCRSCNSSKNNLTYSEWFEKRAQKAQHLC